MEVRERPHDSTEIRREAVNNKISLQTLKTESVAGSSGIRPKGAYWGAVGSQGDHCEFSQNPFKFPTLPLSYFSYVWLDFNSFVQVWFHFARVCFISFEPLCFAIRGSPKDARPLERAGGGVYTMGPWVDG